jgi:Domain of unknown function (DUF4333)
VGAGVAMAASLAGCSVFGFKTDEVARQIRVEIELRTHLGTVSSSTCPRLGHAHPEKGDRFRCAVKLSDGTRIPYRVVLTAANTFNCEFSYDATARRGPLRHLAADVGASCTEPSP